MSSITGIYRRDGGIIDNDSITNMNNKLSHRGPNGSHTYCDINVAFGHQMLWTTKESVNETLPFFDQESELFITSDARIDNRNDLSQKLGISDTEFVSDSYFILKAYENWGEQCPEYLLGDFAFVIWDKNKEKLFCARDHMGVKPFYYYYSDDIFLFATEYKAFFSFPDFYKKINNIRIAFHLMPLYENKNNTFYKGIYRLPAAHSMCVSRDEIKLRQYWKLDPNSELLLKSDEEYIKVFHEIFEEAVKCRLRTPFSLGFQLSGGLDSSSVVCMSKKILNNSKLNTFSTVFRDISESDERTYINYVAKTGCIKTNFHNADSVSPLKNIEKIMWYLEEPFQTPNMAMIWDLYSLMQKKGIRILLGGQDGDVTLSRGEKYFLELFKSLQWGKLRDEIKYKSGLLNNNPYNIFFGEVIFPMVPTFIKTIFRFFKGIRRKPDTFILNNNFINAVSAKKYLTEFYDNEPKNYKQFHHFLITLGTHQSTFENFDRVAAAFFIEHRYPFYDKRLIEFCYAIPNEQKFKFGWDRFLLRKAMDGILPEEIQWRRDKAEFSYFFDRNLVIHEKTRVDEMIYGGEQNYLLKDFVDMNKIDDVYNKLKKGKYGSNSKDLWAFITLNIWLNMFMDNTERGIL